MKGWLVLTSVAVFGIMAHAADADATGIVPKLAITFNDKTLSSAGSVTMAGQTSVPAADFVEAANGYALDMNAVGSSVTLYSGSNGQLSGNSSSETVAPFAVSLFGTIPNTARQILFQAQYYTVSRGVCLGFDASGKLTYWWVGGSSSWSTAQNLTLPENHDWTAAHHYVFSFGNGTDGILRFYVDGECVSTLSPLNNISSGYRNPAAKSYQALYFGNGFSMNSYNSTTGVVDDVRFYAATDAAQAIDGVNYVLSDAMVADLYADLTGGNAVVKIGTAGYDSLASAVAAVSAGQTLTLCRNIVLTESVAIPAGVDIDFAGYAISTTTDGVSLSATSDIYEIDSASETVEEVTATTFSKVWKDNVIVWNGATGASWGVAGNWLVKGETAEAVPAATDTVIFPAHIDDARSVVVAAIVQPAAVIVSGKYAFSGAGEIDLASVTIKDAAEFGIAAANVYTGAIARVGTDACIRVAVGEGNAYALGALTGPWLADGNSSTLYIDSGDIVCTSPYRIATIIASGASLTVRGSFSGLVNDYYKWFQGAGDLILDGVTLSMSGKGDYGSVLTRFAGTLTLTNGTTVAFSSNGNTAGGLGTGKAVLAGCTLSEGNTGAGSFANTSIEVVAGTVNTCNSNFPLPLDKVVVTGGSAEMTKAQRTVLTTTKGSLTTGATISDGTKSLGWKVRTVTHYEEDGETVKNYTVELYKSGFVMFVR